MPLLGAPPGVHLEVDDGVDGRVGHGEPEESQEDVLGAGPAPGLLPESSSSVSLFSVPHK